MMIMSLMVVDDDTLGVNNARLSCEIELSFVATLSYLHDSSVSPSLKYLLEVINHFIIVSLLYLYCFYEV